MKESPISKAYRILEEYNGENNQILYYKKMHSLHKLILTEDGFETEYIIKNKDYQVENLNKIVKISSALGKKLQEKYEIDFTPKKLRIISIIGEMKSSYHCYVQYRNSVPAMLMFINKRQILTPLHIVDYNSIEIDFTPFNEKLSEIGRKLKPHQETGVKFLVGNKKCVLADSMGTGKTVQAIVAALAAGCKKILVITTASLKSTWKREISYFENLNDIVIVNGSKWDGTAGKFTVINYDIVQNYYEIPYENEYKIEKIYGKDGKVEELKVPVMIKDKKTGKMVNKQVKSNKKVDIKKALLNSPLFTSNFDCVIIDEAQKLSNNTSNRYKVIYDFLRKSSIKYVFLVTGTPLTNTPMNLYYILRLIDADVTKDYNYYLKTYCDGKEMFRPGEWNKWLLVFERSNHVKWASMEPKEKSVAFQFINEHAEKMVIPQGSTNLNELREKIKHVYIRRLASDVGGMVNKYLDTRYYDLDDRQKEEYDKLWDEYVAAQEENGDNTNEEYRQLVEGTLVRQFLAKEMIPNTISLANDYIEDGEKVIIACNYTSEINAFKEYYGKQAVVYDGKMTPKQKDKSEKEFMENPKIKVFIGQIESAGVGLTLTESHIMIFNSYSWLETSNRQMQDRIYRITQKEDALCIYQLFTDSISQDMFEKVLRKGLVMDETIKSEKDK